MGDFGIVLGWINDAIFVSLVNTTLQITILILVVAFFIRVFRIKTSTIRYSLWLFVLLAMIALPLLTPFVPQIDFARFRRQGTTEDGSDYRWMMGATNAGELSEAGDSVSSKVVEKAVASRDMDVSLINPVSVAYFIWCAGMLFMLYITIAAYLRLRKLRMCSSDVKDRVVLGMLSQLRRRIGVRKPVGLKVSPDIYTPTSLGIFSNVIILPDGVIDDISEDDLEMILTHELAHIRRYDHLVNMLQNVMRGIFFFHPLFHLMNRSLAREREHICDDWVIDITRKRSQYAQCIVGLLERMVYRPINMPVSMALAERQRDIPGRIDMIVDRTRGTATRLSRRGLFALLLIGCLFLPVIAGIGLVRFARAQAPQKAQLAFFSGRDGNLDDYNFEIYVMDADGKNQRRLTDDPALDRYPSWSHDGQTIAFNSDRDGNDEVYIMDADGKNQLNLTNSPAEDFSPNWSPDDKRIAFTSNRDGNDEIYVMGADGRNQTRLTNNPARDWSSSWSPDGTKIAFASDRDGNGEVYIMDADGQNSRNLTNNPAWDGIPAWSPDGRWIAFASDRDGNFEIYVINTNGNNQHRLTSNPADDSSPAWSPDSQRIVFESYRDGNSEIYVMDADGNNQLNLTIHPQMDMSPSWFDPAFAYSISSAGRMRSTWGKIKALVRPQ